MSSLTPLPHFLSATKFHPSFETDVRDVHLVYDYDTHAIDGKPEKWRYEMWFFSENRIVYAIHGGPMAGRINYQTATYQCIRPGELWQCNWLEETGTICSLVYDITNKSITTFIAFSKGHWEMPHYAHGDKRDAVDFDRWRGLAKLGIHTDRYLLSEQAQILQHFKGKGDLVPIDDDVPTF
ncbi:uncharacterized protein G6M90_00g052240 [Metarhizium brunneum]|uniref:Phenol acid carboxylase n=1 Tax=Metarhizium brunneum TaxID=500148 RepID=A0A7D5Z7P9_9HYPO